MKTNTFLTAFLLTLSQTGYSQNGDNHITADHSKLSLYFGYGTLGANIRLDLEITDRYFKESSTRLYLEGGGQGITFEEENFLLDNIMYPSDCRILAFGVGIAQEFRIGRRLSLMPFAGLRNEYVRFKSQELVDAIDGHSLQRYADTAMTIPVGPLVENAYGDASALDIGCRLGIALGKRVELNCTAGYASIHFDTASTLFGQYHGQAPYKNAYWVKRPPIRFEGSLRILF